MKIDLFDLEARAAALANRLAAEAERIAANENLTPAGHASQWKTMAPKFADDVAEVVGLHRAARAGASRMFDYARAAAVGTPPDPTAPDAALELALARLLSRHEKWGVQQFIDTLAPIKGTTLGAALVEELIARRAIDAELVDSVVEQLTPTIAEARHIQPRLIGMIDTAIAPLIAEVENLAEVGPLAERAPLTGDIRRTERTTLYDMVRDGEMVIHETGQFEYDLPYLMQVTFGVDTENLED